MRYTQETRDILIGKGYHSSAPLKEYLEDVADTYGADFGDVASVASILGQDELFDGLLSEVADMTGNPFMNVGD